MDKYIYYADRIVSVEEPYINDKFVHSHHRPALPSEVNELLSVYRDLSIKNRLLSNVLIHLHELGKGDSVRVVDIGVFMGSFSNAVSLASRFLKVPVLIDSWEANPQLISALIKNFQLYQSKVHLHLSGIGRERGVMELVVSPGGAIGASLANTASRKYGEYFACDVDVRPLCDVLDDDFTPGLVKIDIEGYEVPSFSSIVGDANRLNNIFIVEFAPRQADERVAPDQRFGDFLLDNFQIYNVGNWGWFTKATIIRSYDELIGANLGNGGANTDLVLVPKQFAGGAAIV